MGFEGKIAHTVKMPDIKRFLVGTLPTYAQGAKIVQGERYT